MRILTPILISAVLTGGLICTAGAQNPGAPPPGLQAQKKQQKKKAPSPGSGQQQGVRKGKKAGPMDGSGPIHPPGTGGGTGAGQRGPKR
jgi:hypothetical protein